MPRSYRIRLVPSSASAAWRRRDNLVPWTSGRPKSRSCCAAPCASSPKPRCGRTSREWDEAQHFPAELMPKLAALGPDGHPVPGGVRRRRHVGGRLLHLHRRARARRSRRSRCRSPRTTACAPAHIAMFGTEAQKQQYLRAARARREARRLGADRSRRRAATPPACGRRPTRDGDGWVLNGSKTFTTHGAIGDVMVVMAVTDRAAGANGHLRVHRRARHAGHDGRARRKTSSACARATRAKCSSSDCRVPADQLLGEEGQGFVNTLQVLDAGRIGIAALSVGLAQGAYEAALRYAQRAHGSSASRSPRSRRSSGSSPTARRGSKRRGC